METEINILKQLHIPGTKTQLGLKDETFWQVTDPKEFDLLPEFVKKHEDKDLYFLPGARIDGPSRASDKDIVARSFFVADFDIRSFVKKEHPNDPPPTDEEICGVWADGIIHELDNCVRDGKDYSSFFGSWSYVVFTGNGLHIYYVGNPIEGPSDGGLFKDAVRELFSKIDRAVFPICDTDKACCNPGRIIRIPGSFNNGKKFGPDPIKGEVLHIRDSFPSKMFETIPAVFLQQQKKKLEAANNTEVRRYNNADNGVFDSICSISIGDIACRVLGLETDGRRFYEPGQKRKDKGFFQIPGSNLIYNEGSDHLRDALKTYNTFTFVRDLQRHNFDNKKTFEYFREHYDSYLPKDSNRMPTPSR